MVVLGSTDVPTVATFMKVFEQNRYNPKIFIAVSGPDQGQAFENIVGKANADGMMVPDGWYGAYSNALSNAMVEEYIARYGGTCHRHQRRRGRGVLGRRGRGGRDQRDRRDQ